MKRVKVYSEHRAERKGQGMYAAALMKHFPLMPVEEEGRLNDARLRDNFIVRVFAYNRLRELLKRDSAARRLSIFIRPINICCWRTAPVITKKWGNWLRLLRK